MTEPNQHRALHRLRTRLRLLYHGHSPLALRFQAWVLLVDLAILVFFAFSPILRDQPAFLWIDYLVAAIVAVDFAARMLASNDIARWWRQPTTWVDVFILLTLLAPFWLANFGFLRILRLWTLSRGSAMWRPLKRFGLEQYRETGHAIINLLTFLFLVTGFVYTFYARNGSGIDNYIDALYFTVTTVTTTGFGDITLPGNGGKLTSILVMIVGITLFVRLAQSIFRPAKVTFPCPQCGLQRHEPDAVHCKACGHVLNIPDEGN